MDSDGVENSPDANTEVRHPILRHQDMSLYYRQRGNRYALGNYRHEPILFDPEDLRERLSVLLPHYLVPGQIRRVDALPLLASGKIDTPCLSAAVRTALSAVLVWGSIDAMASSSVLKRFAIIGTRQVTLFLCFHPRR